MSVTEFMWKFINNICRCREEAGLSVLELSRLSGVSLEMLEELEGGSVPNEMTVDDAARLANILHCKTYELFK